MLSILDETIPMGRTNEGDLQLRRITETLLVSITEVTHTTVPKGDWKTTF